MHDHHRVSRRALRGGGNPARRVQLPVEAFRSRGHRGGRAAGPGHSRGVDVPGPVPASPRDGAAGDPACRPLGLRYRVGDRNRGVRSLPACERVHRHRRARNGDFGRAAAPRPPTGRDPARHRQVADPPPRALQAGQAHNRGVGDHAGPPRRGREDRPEVPLPARGVRHHSPSPRALRRIRLSRCPAGRCHSPERADLLGRGRVRHDHGGTVLQAGPDAGVRSRGAPSRKRVAVRSRGRRRFRARLRLRQRHARRQRRDPEDERRRRGHLQPDGRGLRRVPPGGGAGRLERQRQRQSLASAPAIRTHPAARVLPRSGRAALTVDRRAG